MDSRDKTLKEATAHELVVEFMTRNCHTRRAALRDELDHMDVHDLMEIFDINEITTLKNALCEAWAREANKP